MNKIFFYAALCILALTVSCKEDLSDVKLMMEGDPIIDIDDYVSVGSEWSLEGHGVLVPSEGVGYMWRITDFLDQDDTTDVFTFRFGDVPGEYRIVCTAFHPEYYDNPANKYVTVIDTAFNASLKLGEIGIDGIFVDERDGHEYRYVNVGGLDWFVSNLAYRGCGESYLGNDVMWGVFGGYYTYEEATAGDICPEGWRVPSEDDWGSLAGEYADRSEAGVYYGAAPSMMSDAIFNEEKLWSYSPDNEPSNESGFSAIPSGYASLGRYTGIKEYAVFWSSGTTADGNGIYHYIYYDQPDLRINAASGDFRASVRCVRDR